MPTPPSAPTPEPPELPSPELIEQQRRSIAMLGPGVWALRREEAIDVLEVLVRALRTLRAS